MAREYEQEEIKPEFHGEENMATFENPHGTIGVVFRRNLRGLRQELRGADPSIRPQGVYMDVDRRRCEDAIEEVRRSYRGEIPLEKLNEALLLGS